LWEITKQGMEFYSDFFDYAYPFDKYDQIFVPEFNAGAMENVGAVTHSERMVFRDPPTENQRSSRAMVILHEMAHMWFGNLVTMRWWNDLWLNESFAEYMAHLALDESTRFTTAWQAFNARKAWAYRQDQLVTTHPIAGQVADTDQTLLNFDGITYAKGAATIQQLVAVLGMDGFRDAMRGYFRRHAFGNTTLHEFLDALQTGAGDTGGAVGDLHQWARVWLETPSLNTLAASWEVDGDRLSRLAIAQTAPPEYPTLRPHQIEVALVRERGGRLEVEALPVHVEGAETEVPAAIGRPAPRLVVPNHNDHAFVKIALDPASLAFVRGNLQRIEDPLLRQLIWQALWNMVRDQQLRSTDYLDLAAAKIEGERDQELVETILGNVQAAIGRYLPDALRQERAHAVSEVAWRALQTAPTGDLQIIWARALIGLAISPPDIERVARLVDGELAVAGLAIDQEMRWAVAVLYVGYGLPGAQQRLAAERARDPSDRGQRALLRAEASVPDAAVKARAWERFLGEGYGSLHLTAAAMGGFHWWVQRELVAPYVERFFEAAPLVFEQKEKEFAQSFFGALFPSGRVEQAVLDRSERLLAEIGDGWPLLRRSLREANDDLARAIKCRAFAASGG
ncbi:MAG: aminopeptidase N, partial [Dehalococcoidia bacterium]|nr:aminopeptidase N [Dehalococcoidia bacterium]